MKQTEILTHATHVNTGKRLGTNRLHELHESKFPFVTRLELIRSKLSIFSPHVSGVTGMSEGRRKAGRGTEVKGPRNSQRPKTCSRAFRAPSRHIQAGRVVR